VVPSKDRFALEFFLMLVLHQHQFGSVTSIDLKKYHYSQFIVSTPPIVGQ
jgi:hypothetical protein